jgi:hypothetical protein
MVHFNHEGSAPGTEYHDIPIAAPQEVGGSKTKQSNWKPYPPLISR